MACKCHPGNIVEAVSLADSDLPALTFPILDSLGDQVSKGLLSDLQLEVGISMTGSISPSTSHADMHALARSLVLSRVRGLALSCTSVPLH